MPLASRQIGIDEVEQAMQNANVNMPMGTLFGANKAYNLQSNGQLNDAALIVRSSSLTAMAPQCGSIRSLR